MPYSKKIGPSFVAASAILAASVAAGSVATGCSASRGGESEDQSSAALTVSPDLVISQVYAGGGLSGASYQKDFVEIFNRGSSAVSLNNKVIQFAGTASNFSSSTATVLPNVNLDPGHYYLVTFHSAGAVGSTVTGDQDDPSVDLTASNGKVALVDSGSLLNGCGATATQCAAGGWIDFVGYGTAQQAEGTKVGALSSTKAALRKGGGCQDTGDNAADFTVGTPAPRSSSTSPITCGGDAGPPVDSGSGTDAGTDSGESPSEVLLNEVRINPAGTSDAPFEFAEVLCTPNASLDGYYFAAIEGDGESTPGTADVVVDLGGHACGSNGIVYIKASVGGTGAISGQSTVIETAALNAGGSSSSPLENATTSFVIIHSASAAIVATTDYDTNNDGTLELPGSAVVVDGISTFDQSDAATDLTYAPRLILAASPPDGVTRIPGDTTAMSASSWYFGELVQGGSSGGDTVAYDVTKVSAGFPSDGEMTPGAPNVGTGSPITDGGSSTDSGSSSTDGGTKTDAGKKDGGTTTTDDSGSEEPTDDGGASSGSSDGGKKSDSGKSGSSNGSGSSGSVPTSSSSGCSVATTGYGAGYGFFANALGALLGLAGLRRRRR